MIRETYLNKAVMKKKKQASKPTSKVGVEAEFEDRQISLGGTLWPQQGATLPPLPTAQPR